MFIPRANYNNPEKKIIIFSGAGLSAESGISTFRDTNGLWENHKIEEVCTEATWKQNFDLIHDFYNQRRLQLAEVVPNAAHEAIARIQDKFKDNCYVITQNVDDLLERAGVPQVLHVHGELTKLDCTACGHKWDIGYTEFSRCPKCDSLKGVRPSIVFFGGSAPMYSYMFRAFEYLQNPESILIVIGTMGNVVPIRHIIGREIRKSKEMSFVKSIKGKAILNNLEASEYLPENLFNHVFYEKASETLPKIEEFLDENFN